MPKIKSLNKAIHEITKRLKQVAYFLYFAAG
jgi:hypothetical protein